MAEQVDLTTPITIPSITNWTVDELHLKWSAQNIYIVLKGSNGEVSTFNYNQQEALTLMKLLNKANLSIKSLHRRIMEKLIADGYLAGTISGAP